MDHFTMCPGPAFNIKTVFPSLGIPIIKTRPMLERRKTLGHLRSINRNMVIHFANQSQTCHLLKILKNIFFQTFPEKKLWSGAINPRLNWYRKSISIIKSAIYIYIYNMSSSCYRRVSRPQFCWGLAILCDPPFFSGYIEFGGVVVKFYSSVEITLYLLADFLLQYVTLFQSRDIVKNLVSL